MTGWILPQSCGGKDHDFEEINHVVKHQEGIFTSKRNAQSLLNTIKFVMDNYANIHKSIKKNKLPMKHEFISQMCKILD